MKKIITVGHPQSGYESVGELLISYGMKAALPSRREGFTPTQISEILVKAHGATPVQNLEAFERIKQIDVSPVWQGMALDLMLANMEQPLWGWADTQAIYLLDYWKSQDPQIFFVLVFDEPHSIFTHPSSENADATSDSIDERVNAWIAYNKALLHFHLRNQECSLLIHKQQFNYFSKSSLQKINAHIDNSLKSPCDEEKKCGDVGNTTRNLYELTQTETAQTLDHGEDVQGALEKWLAQEILGKYPQAVGLYEELLTSTSLLSSSDEVGDSINIISPRKGSDIDSILPVWRDFLAQQDLIQKQADGIAFIKNESQVYYAQLNEINKAYEEKSTAIKEHKEKIQELEIKISVLTDSYKHENFLILNQLHRAQEELTSHFQKVIQQKKEISRLTGVASDLKIAKEENIEIKYQLEKLKQSLKNNEAKLQGLKRIERKMAAEISSLQQIALSSTKKSDHELLLIQLNQAQKKLEYLYAENRLLKSRNYSNKKINTLDNRRKKYYGAADRIKQQLSYRLGATMIANSHNIKGWLKMPLALRSEVKDFRENQKIREASKLPPITKYCDFHEAERIKQHLSYRLGNTLILKSKSVSGWISMPWSLYNEVVDFRKNRSL